MKTTTLKCTKPLAVLLTILLFLLAPLTALAANDTVYSEGYFCYHLGTGYVSICGYLGKGTEVVIPESIAGRPVSEIEDHAFDDADTIEIITVPATVTMIGKEAFTGAGSLKKIISSTEGINIVAASSVEIVLISPRTEESKNEEAWNPTEESKNEEASKSTEESKNGEASKSTEESKNGEASNPTEKSKNEETSKSTAGLGEAEYEEVEGELIEPSTATGIPVQGTTDVVMVDANGHLVLTIQSGTVILLDDTQTYTQTEKADGTTVIKNQFGGEVTVDESGNVNIPGQATAEPAAGSESTAEENSAESVTAESAIAESAPAESATVESVTAESATAESATAESVTAESATSVNIPTGVCVLLAVAVLLLGAGGGWLWYHKKGR